MDTSPAKNDGAQRWRADEPPEAVPADTVSKPPRLPIARPPTRRVADGPVAETPPVAEDEHGLPRAAERKPIIGHAIFQKSLAFLASMVVHLILLVVLGLLVLPDHVKHVLTELTIVKVDPLEEERLTVELDQQQFASTSTAVAASTAGLREDGIGALAAMITPQLDTAAVAHTSEDAELALSDPLLSLASIEQLVSEVPQGTLGEPRAIVDSYQEAMDRLTQELLLLMEKQKVLVIWCFDQSESMKDDQQEIRDRIQRVYTELGLTGRTQGDRLASAVVSYGSGFRIHTPRPTGKVPQIESAIASVPVDPSGKEMTCQALIASISHYRDLARRARRRMALVLVTDESGDRAENHQLVETAIGQAKDAGCIVYILGREAVFGYPYAHFRWQHPQTKAHHWLPVDRGPETAFVELLQTDGFRRRYGAFPSGFGSYEQARIASQTGGIFFMLPTLETTLVHGEKRRYELEAMRSYMPDLRARQEIYFDRDASVLRLGILKVVYDLNPYDPDTAKVIVMRVHFSTDLATFARQVQQEKAKAAVYVTYLDRASLAMSELAALRQSEYTPRWQANYDLIHAQLYAYKARLFEYGAYLDQFLKNPRVVPLTKPPDRRLRWDIRVRRETITGELIAPIVQQSTAMFQQVLRDHPGTPWAARAQRELLRGFGVELVPTYHSPTISVSNPMPLPKL